MAARRVVGVLSLFVLLIVGVWLLGRPGRLRPEGAARLRAMRSLALVGAGRPGASGAPDAVAPDAIAPAPVQGATAQVVDFSRIERSTERRDDMIARWLDGELDMDESDSYFTAAEMEALAAAALARRPDHNVQQAVSVGGSGPQPAAPSPGLAFDSIDYAQSVGFVPPDPDIAVGPRHIVVAVNVNIAVYDKTGAELLPPLAAADAFDIAGCDAGLYDPKVLYDEEEDRWLIGYAQGKREEDGGYCLLASQSSDPLGLWNAYKFQLNGASAWLDFPQAGVGDSYIVMGANMFDYSDIFVEVRLFAFDKAALYAGAAVTPVVRQMGHVPFTAQPLNIHGAASGNWPTFGDVHYVLLDYFDGQNYQLLRWDVALDTITATDISLTAYGWPLPSPQDHFSTLTANDWAILDFEYDYYDGHHYGWTAMTVSCSPGAGVVNCIRWAQFDLETGTLGPAGEGVYSSIAQYRSFPDLAVNRCGDMAVGYALTSPSSYPGIAVTGREQGDAPGLLQAEQLLKAGETAYVIGAATEHLWGDYTGMTIDPDGATFWYYGMYSKSGIGPDAPWGTYVGSFQFEACTPLEPAPRIDLTPERLQGTQLVDSVAAHPLTIANVGNEALHWTVDAAPQGCDTPQAVAWLALDAAAGTTAAGSSNQLEVTFDATGLAPGVYEAHLCVASNDALRSMVDAPLQMTVVSPGYDVQLGPDDAATAAPGATVTYTVQILNSGNVTDTYDLSVSGATWPTALSQNSLTLSAGATATFAATVDVPSDAGDGDSDAAVVTATSQGDGARSDAVTLTTTAQRPLEEVYGVELSADQAATAAPGEAANYTVQITNTGNARDSFTLSVSGAAWPTTLSHSSVALDAGAGASFTVRVNVPSDADDGDGDAALITATSQSDATKNDTATLTTTADVVDVPEGWEMWLPVVVKG